MEQTGKAICTKPRHERKQKQEPKPGGFSLPAAKQAIQRQPDFKPALDLLDALPPPE